MMNSSVLTMPSTVPSPQAREGVGMIEHSRAEAKDFRLLEDAIIKIYSVMRGLSRLEAKSPEKKR